MTRIARIALTLFALSAAAAADDATVDLRGKFAIADTLTVVSAEVDDQSATDGPVRTTLRCRLEQPGTYTFEFEPHGKAGQARSIAVAWPPPPPSPLSAVRPGGIHGGPPVTAVAKFGPTVVRDAHDDRLVTVAWPYGLSRRGPFGFNLSRCDFKPATAAATRPATAPAR